MGEAFDFGVDWDDARNTIIIDTSIGYTHDAATQNAELTARQNTELPLIYHGKLTDAAGGVTGVFVLVAPHEERDKTRLDVYRYLGSPSNLNGNFEDAIDVAFWLTRDMIFSFHLIPAENGGGSLGLNDVTVSGNSASYTMRHIAASIELSRITRAEFDNLTRGTEILDSLKSRPSSAYNYE